MYPSDVKYTKNHEFIKPLGDGTALIGITSYAQEALGDVVFVDLPEVGAKFSAGDEFGTVESVKTVSEIFMPSAGEVLAVNEELEAHPEYVNEDAFGKGWMVKVKLDGPLASDLLDDAAYTALVSEESH
ncbi:MAG: glycine cleavage system protein GcvH [Holophaga sp.]|nr:glycine cleavage system protein GcvH [Holophaga sp.]